MDNSQEEKESLLKLPVFFAHSILFPSWCPKIPFFNCFLLLKKLSVAILLEQVS